jgi:hypothetical protein
LTVTDIPPGGVGEIEVNFHTANRQGHQRRVITVTSDDPVNPSVDLYIEADIQVEFDLVQRSLIFKEVYEGTPVTKSAFVRVIDKKLVQITEVKASEPYVSAKLVPSAEPDTTDLYEIAVTITPTPELSNFRANVIISSNLESKPEVQLFVSGYVTAGKPEEEPTGTP